jgi:EpsI family protein
MRRSDFIKAAALAATMGGSSLLAMAATPRHFLADEYTRESLHSLIPRQFGPWSVDESIVPVPPSPDLQAALDETYDEVLAQTYRDAEGHRMMLSIAYGRNQHKGMNTHRPEVCYPAQGFKEVSATVQASVPAVDVGVPVNRLVMQMGNRVEPITYWLLVGDTITAFGYPQRRVAISYGLRGLVPDGILFRVSSIDPQASRAFDLQNRFIADILAAIPAAKRNRFIGDLAKGPDPA